MQHTLVTTNLRYSLDKKVLLKDINLEFQSGYLHGILGPNGSGKSTLLKTLSGIWKPTSGQVLWNGEDLLCKDRKEISRILSVVPQNPQPNFDFLVEDIVAMGRYPYHSHYWKAVEDQHVYKALTLVDAWHLRRRQVNQLSQGERQRVYIARALVTESPILLLDEPTASLDIQHQIEIWQLLERLVQQDKVIIVTTHDLSIAERYCQKVAVLNRGKCIGNGSFSSFITPTLLQEVFGVIECSSSSFKHYMLPGI